MKEETSRTCSPHVDDVECCEPRPGDIVTQDSEPKGGSSSPSPREEEMVIAPRSNQKKTIGKRGSFIPRTEFSFSKDLSTDQESPGEKPARRRRIRRTKPTPRVEEGSRTSDENAVAKPADSLFSETTKRYLKSTGLHSKRIERLLMKYLGPSQEIVEQECVTPCPSPRSFGEIEACATANNA